MAKISFVCITVRVHSGYQKRKNIVRVFSFRLSVQKHCKTTVILIVMVVNLKRLTFDKILWLKAHRIISNWDCLFLSIAVWFFSIFAKFDSSLIEPQHRKRVEDLPNGVVAVCVNQSKVTVDTSKNHEYFFSDCSYSTNIQEVLKKE